MRRLRVTGEAPSASWALLLGPESHAAHSMAFIPWLMTPCRVSFAGKGEQE